MRRVRTLMLLLAVILFLGLLAAFSTVFVRPELIPPGPYHPRSLYCRLVGYDVHPWVRVDPARSYTLRVWSTRWPIFRDGYGYDDLIDEVAADFRLTYPGVRVEYVLLRLDEIGLAVAQAVANSSPPDVCIAPFDPSLVESGFVVPLDMFMRGEEGNDAAADAFEQCALRSVSPGGRVWAWPSWVAVQSWAGNAQILREAGVDVERVMTHGWTYDDVLNMTRTLSSRQAGAEERDRTYALVLDASSVGTLDVLMRASGQGMLLAPDGGLAWQPLALTSALSFLDQERREGAFPVPAASMGERMLELFWTGRTAVIGPVGPGFARHVRERNQSMTGGSLPAAYRSVEAVLLPVPHAPAGRMGQYVSVTAASAFCAPGRGGTDTARLAVEFALRLARKEALWLARELPVVPAHLEDRGEVLGAIGPDGASERFLLAAAASGTASGHTSATLADKEAELKEKVLGPALAAFWKGEIGPAAFVHRVTAGLLEDARGAR